MSTTKWRNRQTFRATIDGELILFFAHTTSTRCGFCHTVYCSDLSKYGKAENTKVSYYNRTWERFDYETCLKKAIAKFPKSLQPALTEQIIERKSAEEWEKAEQQVQAFKQLHDGLTDRQKELLAQAPPMQSEQDVQFTMGIMGAMNLLNQINN